MLPPYEELGYADKLIQQENGIEQQNRTNQDIYTPWDKTTPRLRTAGAKVPMKVPVVTNMEEQNDFTMKTRSRHTHRRIMGSISGSISSSSLDANYLRE
jgi:hypothetical protein